MPDRLAASLAPEFTVVDHGELLQVTLPDGMHVALIARDPLQVELGLSVVLPPSEASDPDALQEWGASADAHLRAGPLPDWTEVGFVAPPVGELVQGEAIDDPDTAVWSYELPVTVRAAAVGQVREILDWALARPREFVLWGVDGPLSALEPVDG